MKNLTLKELCRKIALPTEVQEEVLSFSASIQSENIKMATEKLFERSTWDKGLAEIRELLGTDSRGIKMLTCMLQCGLHTYDNYQKLYIDDVTFVETFKCFTRFIQEYYKSYGKYGFDRAFWTVRQLSTQLFRIGELEYELDLHNDEKVISLHIPSDAILKKEKWEDSTDRAHTFINEKFPLYENARMVCQSWLLSPALKEVLSETSNIIQFQNCFVIQEVDYDSTEFMQWVYPKKDICYENLPEITSLQRNIKSFLLSGGKIGEAFGFLK